MSIRLSTSSLLVIAIACAGTNPPALAPRADTSEVTKVSRPEATSASPPQVSRPATARGAYEAFTKAILAGDRKAAMALVASSVRPADVDGLVAEEPFRLAPVDTDTMVKLAEDRDGTGCEYFPAYLEFANSVHHLVICVKRTEGAFRVASVDELGPPPPPPLPPPPEEAVTAIALRGTISSCTKKHLSIRLDTASSDSQAGLAAAHPGTTCDLLWVIDGFVPIFVGSSYGELLFATATVRDVKDQTIGLEIAKRRIFSNEYTVVRPGMTSTFKGGTVTVSPPPTDRQLRFLDGIDCEVGPFRPQTKVELRWRVKASGVSGCTVVSNAAFP